MWGGRWKTQPLKARQLRRGEKEGEEEGKSVRCDGIHLFCYARTKTYSCERVHTRGEGGRIFSIQWQTALVQLEAKHPN